MYNKIKASMVETICGPSCNFQIVFSSWSSLSLRFERYISSLLRFREINNTHQPWSSSAWLAAAGYFSEFVLYTIRWPHDLELRYFKRANSRYALLRGWNITTTFEDCIIIRSSVMVYIVSGIYKVWDLDLIISNVLNHALVIWLPFHHFKLYRAFSSFVKRSNGTDTQTGRRSASLGRATLQSNTVID